MMASSCSLLSGKVFLLIQLPPVMLVHAERIIIFKKGKFYKEVDEKDALNELFKELLTFKK